MPSLHGYEDFSGRYRGAFDGRDRDYAGGAGQLGPKGFLSANPLRHYIGWSSQADPRERIYDHGPAALREIVYLEPGTMNDEAELKVIGRCPKCGERYADDLVPEARRRGVLRLLQQMHEATGEDADRLRELSRRSSARREDRGNTRDV